MKWIHTAALALALAPLFAVSSGCDPKEEPKPVVVAPPPAIKPTPERAMLRVQERWNKGMAKDWVAAYDYTAPEFKREQPLARYLSGMQIHRYENMRPVEVVSIQGDNAFVRVTGIWTPESSQIPQMKHLKTEPGQTMTQEITMIETWRFVEGDWCYVRPDRENEFFEAHPDLLKKSGEPTPAAQPAEPAPK